jgi:glycosyltransferase involved in cell wall biosynthesis
MHKTIAFIFNHSYFLGGGEFSLFELIRTIDRTKFRPIVIVPDFGDIERILESLNIKTYVIRFPSLKRIFSISFIRTFYNICKIVKEQQVDLFHVNGSRVCFYGSIIGRLFQIPVIWHVRESIKDVKIFDYLLATLSTIIICVSKSVQSKRFLDFSNRINKKIVIVYNGVDTKLFKKCLKNRKRVRGKLPLKSNEILIGLIGNIIPRKAQDFFLISLAKAKSIRPDLKIKALLVGHCLDKNYANYLRQLVYELNLDSEVIIKEFTNNIQNILSALDIYVLSSKSEGFCRSLLEAMSCGLPIIATKIGEIEEAIIDKQNGFLVNHMDTDEMAAIIIELCQNTSMRDQIGTLNRSIVNKKFNLIEHKNKIQALYLKSI